MERQLGNFRTYSCAAIMFPFIVAVFEYVLGMNLESTTNLRDKIYLVTLIILFLLSLVRVRLVVGVSLRGEREMRKVFAFVGIFFLLCLFGCRGNPFREFRILNVKVTPTELPPEGGTFRIEVDATRGDRATAIVARRFIGFTITLFRVKLGLVDAIDFEKVRWKASVQLPPNHTEDDIVYTIFISVYRDGERDERLAEVVVRGRKKSN